MAGQSIPNLVIVPLASDPRALRILGFSRSVCPTGVLWRGWPTEARGVWRHVPLGVSSVRTGELSENFGQDGEVLGTSRCHTRRAVCHCLRGASLAAISQAAIMSALGSTSLGQFAHGSSLLGRFLGPLARVSQPDAYVA